VLFNSICIGTAHNGRIFPGDQLFISLHAMPMYQQNTEDLSVDSMLNIPGKNWIWHLHCRRISTTVIEQTHHMFWKCKSKMILCFEIKKALAMHCI